MKIITGDGFEIYMAVRQVFGHQDAIEVWNARTSRSTIDLHIDQKDPTDFVCRDQDEFDRLTAALVARKLSHEAD